MHKLAAMADRGIGMPPSCLTVCPSTHPPNQCFVMSDTRLLQASDLYREVVHSAHYAGESDRALRLFRRKEFRAVGYYCVIITVA